VEDEALLCLAKGILEVVSKPPLGPNLCVGRKIQIIEILEYYSGLNLAAALTLNPIEGFEITSITPSGLSPKELI
jgi:hypothetical protein